MPKRISLRLTILAAVTSTALLGGLAANGGTATAVAQASPAVSACASSFADVARVKAGAIAQEPEPYPKNQANAYGVLNDTPTPARRQRPRRDGVPHDLGSPEHARRRRPAGRA